MEDAGLGHPVELVDGEASMSRGKAHVPQVTATTSPMGSSSIEARCNRGAARKTPGSWRGYGRDSALRARSCPKGGPNQMTSLATIGFTLVSHPLQMLMERLARGVDTGIVDQPVDAPELVDAPLNEPLCLVRRRDVRHLRHGGSAGRANLRDDPLRRGQ